VCVNDSASEGYFVEVLDYIWSEAYLACKIMQASIIEGELNSGFFIR
jgi:hypothetical protein